MQGSRGVSSQSEGSSWQKLTISSATSQRFSEYNRKGFDPGLSKDEWWCVTNISDQIGVLLEEKKGYAAVLEHLRSERQKVFGLTS